MNYYHSWLPLRNDAYWLRDATCHEWRLKPSVSGEEKVNQLQSATVLSAFFGFPIIFSQAAWTFIPAEQVFEVWQPNGSLTTL